MIKQIGLLAAVAYLLAIPAALIDWGGYDPGVFLEAIGGALPAFALGLAAFFGLYGDQRKAANWSLGLTISLSAIVLFGNWYLIA